MAEILIVDKDPSSVELTQEALDHTSYTFLTAATGSEGLSLFKERAPNVLIVEIMMADMDGMEFLKQILDTPCKTEIIVFTAKEGLNPTIKKMNSERLGYLLKPKDYYKLGFIIEKVLKNQRREESFSSLEKTVIEKDEEIGYRKRMEEELRKFSTAVEQCQSSIIITDLEGNIEYANPKFYEISGYEEEEVMGKSPNLLKSGKTPPEEYKNLWDTIRSGKSWHGEFCNKSKNGERYFELACITPILNASGTPTHYLAVKEDITARKEAEEQLAMQHKQLIQSDRMSSIGTLAAGVAHEINNPLNVAIGDIFLFRRDITDMISFIAELSKLPMDDELRKSFNEIREEFNLADILGGVEEKLTRCTEAMERIRSIVSRLRVFSHIDTEEVMEVDINESIETTLDMVPKNYKTEIEIVRNFAKLPLIPINGGEVNQVFMNIFVNACQAMEGKGNLTITTEADSSDVIITIRDDGPGIPEEKINQIFNPFFTTKKIGEGTGLGLSISFSIIEKHGGTISVKNNEERGVTFDIKLPLEGIKGQVSV